MIPTTLEGAFVRLPRPQKVLDPSKPLVPTKASLLQAQNHARTPGTPIAPPIASLPINRESLPHSTISKISEASNGEASIESIQLDGASIDQDIMHDTGPIITLGTFSQDNMEWKVRAQRGRATLIMVKNAKRDEGVSEKAIMEHLNHRNIIKLVHTLQEGNCISLAYEYCRVTLSEILHVHLKLGEQQIQCIARSVSPCFQNNGLSVLI